MATKKIGQLMEESGVQFGTSGARGLVADMNDKVCFAYTLGYIQYLESIGHLQPGSKIAVAGDLRPSTPRIMSAIFRAISFKGYGSVNGGLIPSPAIAYYGIENKTPSIMVTGSHIPDDRNGIKYNTALGEFLKTDEQGLKKESVSIPEELFDSEGFFVEKFEAPSVDSEPTSLYKERYTSLFPSNFLKGLKVGMYQHSAVGRDLLPEILENLGAEVIPFGRSDSFVPVDTEAIRPEDIFLAKTWVVENSVDALFSTDGDSDRPLIGDERGFWLRGDIAGILTSQFLGAESVSTPVSCNTALEKLEQIKDIRRTRIGSPYVIASMIEAQSSGLEKIAGYEANGGYFTQSPFPLFQGTLKPLPTRDTLIVILGILGLVQEKKRPVSKLVAGLPPRFTTSGRLKEFPTKTSGQIIASIQSGDLKKDAEALKNLFQDVPGEVKHIDSTDGIRITFDNGEIIHLRPSGNAPEFRCYIEADTENRALELNSKCLAQMETWR